MVGNTALTNRSPMCISALAIQMAWTTVITDLLAGSSEPQNRTIVMQLIKILPEECASDHLVLVDENVGYDMRDHFVSSSSMVSQLLQTWNGPSEPVYEVCISGIEWLWISKQ
jgi:hypothetical protein